MRNIKVLIVLLLTLLSVSAKTFAQTQLSDQANVSLLTCGPGDEMYSVFGHTAIRVYDPTTRFDVVYNFGSFDFDTPNFYGKFVKGDLQYFVTTSSFDDFVYTYVYYKRDVFEQVLNLTQTQKQNIANELNSIILSDKRFYTYQFIHRNCTTMVADIINNHIDPKISLENTNKGKTYREMLFDALHSHYYENLGISLVFGHKTDEVAQKLFLPNGLMEGVNNTTTTMGPLAKSTISVNEASEESSSSAWNNIYTLSAVCLLLILFSKKELVQRSFLAIFGLLGIFFCFVAFYSSHPELKLNYNILLINPLFLLLLYFIFAKKTKAILMTSYISLAFITLYIIMMFNKPHLALVLPLITPTVVILLRIILDNRQRVVFNS
ncbi:lipoprotein N-acyltransferase Lnb domain-containing protein [Flavobacterium cerinum]|uniref:DUF4105 domain-containing protein n=1 Tax=Flavobacterium cerinum TaxID=2502784 RepID=A0A3S3QA95_9FLAO|nr:DUF4105 domain-containing protein [Flavobacterium cerinum]RWX02408.1 DUF4105 domain-containing protein [Flavobacterium cerinum]